jgi:hypothetical protein
MGMRHSVTRNFWAVVRVTVGVAFTVITLVATFAPLGGADWMRYVPAVGAIVATSLLVVSEYRHAVGRPDIQIGDPEAVSGHHVGRTVTTRNFDTRAMEQEVWPIDFGLTYRLRITNLGAAAAVLVRLESIEPEPSTLPGPRPLHWHRDRANADGDFEESRLVHRHQSDIVDLVSIGRHYPNPANPPPNWVRRPDSCYIHSTRDPDGIEEVELDGNYELLVRADAEQEVVERRFRLVVDSNVGTMQLSAL